MGRTKTALEFNTLTGGLVTDANPLNFPDNATTDELNFVITKNGIRERRLGVDLVAPLASRTLSPVTSYPTTVYTWREQNGVDRLVVQVGANVFIYNYSGGELSSTPSVTITRPGTLTGELIYPCSITSIGVHLVIAWGGPDVTIYSSGTGSVVNRRVKIRDFFGVTSKAYITFDGVPQSIYLLSSDWLTYRPSLTALTDPMLSADNLSIHIYNLRNQSWGSKRKIKNLEDIVDPIAEFVDKAFVLPSNADAVTQALYPDANDADNRTVDRFHAADLLANPYGSVRAPTGHFIIDALDRGASRYSVVSKEQIGMTYQVAEGSLFDDTYSGGFTSTCSFAGRAWFSAFSGDVNGSEVTTDSPSPANMVFFSRIVESVEDIVKCYQDGDPTSKEAPDLLDTDGGFIRIDEAAKITRLVPLADMLLVFATNGVWAISGGSNDGFKATNYVVSKVSSTGSTSVKSMVEVDGAVLAWTESGITAYGKSDFGSVSAKSISDGIISSLYLSISEADKLNCSGFFDRQQRKVFWVYGSAIKTALADTNVLIYDLNLGNFTKWKIPKHVQGHSVVDVFRTTNYASQGGSETVTVLDAAVTVSGVAVTAQTVSISPVSSELAFLVVSNPQSTSVNVGFAKYKDQGWRDWSSVDGVGIDASAYMIPGYVSGNDFQRSKSAPHVHFHFKKTETGFDSEFNPVNASSCKVRVMWDWTTTPDSGRWGSEFQAYKHRRVDFPQSEFDAFNSGEDVVTTRNRLRGSGKVFTMLIKTEPDKALRLIGWSYVVESNENV